MKWNLMTGKMRGVRLLSLCVVFLLVAGACSSDEGAADDAAPSEASGEDVDQELNEEDDPPSAEEGQTRIAVAALMPFTGESAGFGPEQLAGCFAFRDEFEAAGGVGSATEVDCLTVDTEDDPTEAVVASRQLLATEPDLVAILGPSTNVDTVTVPLFEEEQIMMSVTTGNPLYNNLDENEMFWRLVPADDVAGRALALGGDSFGYSVGASVFGADDASQGAVKTFESAWAALGHELVENLTIAPDSVSYSTEALQIANSDAEVLFMETAPEAAAALLSELQKLDAMLPVIGTGVTLLPEWINTVESAIGEEAFGEFYLGGAQGFQPAQEDRGAGWETYDRRIQENSGDVFVPEDWGDWSWSNDAWSMGAYDGLVAAALAMQLSGSLDPAVFNGEILSVTAPGGDKTVVHTFAEGKAALEAGNSIQYVGAGGELIFDEWHNTTGPFEIRNRNGEQVAIISTEQLASVAS